jgi:hypothetical protein
LFFFKKYDYALNYLSKHRCAKDIELSQLIETFWPQINELNLKYHFMSSSDDTTTAEVIDKPFLKHKTQFNAKNNQTKKSMIASSLVTNLSNSIKTKTKNVYASCKTLDQTKYADLNNNYNNNRQSISYLLEFDNFMKIISEKKFQISYVNVPQRPISVDNDGKFKFEIINLIDPHHIYIRPIDTKENEQYLKLSDDINQFYSSKKPMLENYVLKIRHQLIVTNQMCIFYDQNGTKTYYRAFIRHTPLKWSIDNYDSGDDNCSIEVDDKILIYLIDEGVYLTIKKVENLFPIFEDFTKLPPKCVWVKFDGIMPRHEEEEDNDAASIVSDFTIWPKKAINHFKNFLGPYEVFCGSTNQKELLKNKNYGLTFLDPLSLKIESGIVKENGAAEEPLDIDDKMIESTNAVYDFVFHANRTKLNENNFDECDDDLFSASMVDYQQNKMNETLHINYEATDQFNENDETDFRLPDESVTSYDFRQFTTIRLNEFALEARKACNNNISKQQKEGNPPRDKSKTNNCKKN